MDMERNNSSRSVIFERQKSLIPLLTLILNVVSAWNHRIGKFGIAFNEDRRKLGLEVLQENWHTISKGPGYSIWKNPLGDKALNDGTAICFSKAVSYNQNQEIVSEEDLYYSGRKYNTIDAHESEALSITYFFSPQKMGDKTANGWYCSYSGPQRELHMDSSKSDTILYSSTPILINLIQADSVIRTGKLTPPVRGN
jgi:hypothetical protein